MGSVSPFGSVAGLTGQDMATEVAEITTRATPADPYWAARPDRMLHQRRTSAGRLRAVGGQLLAARWNPICAVQAQPFPAAACGHHGLAQGH